jgi:hypothetical protein
MAPSAASGMPNQRIIRWDTSESSTAVVESLPNTGSQTQPTRRHWYSAIQADRKNATIASAAIGIRCAHAEGL